MIIINSSKGQDFGPINIPLPQAEPVLQHKARELIALLRALDVNGLQQLMNISEPLARQTHQQILEFTGAKRKPALFTYSGEVFRSLDANGFSTGDVDHAQAHLRILSGLYGVLRPLDPIAAHRLEMGCKLANPLGKNLYFFWSRDITALLNAAMEESNSDWLINLASLEYSKVVQHKELCRPWLDIQFKEESGGKYRSVAIYGKRARGMMANYLIKNRVKTRDGITHFSMGGYTYRPGLSKERLLVFTRPQP